MERNYKKWINRINVKLDRGGYTGNASDLKSLIDTKVGLIDGKIPASQLPLYVDDVLEYANLASFPTTGETGKIYIAIDTNLIYRWGGSSYVVISSSLALGETSSTAYRGDYGKAAYDHSRITTGNPHNTTKTDIGLGNVPNINATNPANITQTSSYRFVTDSEKAIWNGKQNVLTNPITGTGSTNFLSKFTNTGTLSNSLIFDNGTNVGIGTTSPSEKLEVNGNVKAISFIKTGGTSAQFLMADGSVVEKSTITNGYALANGTNATSNWSNTSSGLSINPTVTGKTLNTSGQTVPLKDATYGTISGIVQDDANSPLANQWSNRLKTLHNNPIGYFTELAQSFTGVEGVWHRRNDAGTISSWKQLYDDSIWNAASISYSGSTLTLTINGISKTTTLYNAGTNIAISGNQISVVSAPTFAGSVTATAFYESSLRELKENIQHFEKSGLELVNSLEIVTFDKKDGSVKDKIGIIADDSPEEFLSDELNAVDLYKTVFIQAKAIQELNAKNLELEERLIKLEKLLSNG